MTNVANDKTLISNGLAEVFAHRSSFIVIGLTGRTGSGCTTVADLLGSVSYDALALPEVPNPPNSNEDRKDRIIREWLKENWSPFKKIQVSQVILMLAISDRNVRFEEFVSLFLPRIDTSKICSVLEPHRAQFNTASNTLLDPNSASDESIFLAYDFIFDVLPRISTQIKEALNLDGRNNYTPIFQALGDNIRKSGSLSNVTEPTRLFAIPECLSKIIKIARIRNKLKGEINNYFVVDALRHPFEIRYLRERIAHFYAMAVTTDDFDRKLRLVQNNLNAGEITRLDEKEYPAEIKDPKKRPTGYDAFVSQDIQACLTISDVYVSNLGRPEAIDTRDTASQVAKYVALMQHPGLITPTSIERCMHAAFSAKLNSGCISRQVGAVITDSNYSIKAVGWNDVPKGQVPCLLRNVKFAISKRLDGNAYSKYEKSDEFTKELKKHKLVGEHSGYINGRNITYCFKSTYNTIKGDKNQVHTRALHAEENAFLQIVKYGGQAIEGGCLFTTASPCELCAKKAYQLGICKIFYIDPYPGISNDHILSVGANPPEVILFCGAIGRAYHNLYEPIMAYKDELEKIFIDNQAL